MIRATTVLWLAIAAVMGAGLFYLKYDVQELERTLARLNGDIAEDERAIHVLTGEWSYLNQPDRLDDLSRRYLGLAPLARARIMRMTELPPRFGAGGLKQPTAGPAAMPGHKEAR